MEDQAIKIVGEVCEREFGLRPCKTNGADEQAKAVLLMGKDVLDAGANESVRSSV